MDFDNTNDTITPDVSSNTITIGGTGSILIPVGSDAQRPSSPISGMLRGSSTSNMLEIYTSAWKPLQFQSANLDALSSLASNGVIARTGSGTFSARTISTASSSRITVTNGDGVSGNPTLDLPSTLTLPGQLNYNTTASIASATTTDIGAATSNYVSITGTTTITGLGTIAAGAMRIVTFAGALTLTHNATSLILPGSANITTAANDSAIFVSLGSGNWICVEYNRANGQALVSASNAQYTTMDSSGNFNTYNWGAGATTKRSIVPGNGTYIVNGPYTVSGQTGTQVISGVNDRTNAFGYYIKYATAAAGTDTAGQYMNVAEFCITNGFFFAARFYLPDASYGSGSTGFRAIIGFTSSSTPAEVSSTNNTSSRILFACFNDGTKSETNWMISTMDGTTETRTSTGIAFTAQHLYDFYLYVDPGGSTVNWKVVDQTISSTATGSVSANLPAAATGLNAGFNIATLTTTARSLGLKNFFIETRL